MKEYLISILSGLVGAVIGGVFSLLGSCITMSKESKKDKEIQEQQFKEDDKKWLRENRLDLFVELVDVLEGYQIPVMFEENNTEYGYVDVKEVENYINLTNEYIDKNKGKLFLFLPSEIFSQIVRIRSKMCDIAFSDKSQKLYYKDFKDSDLFKIIVDAKKISMNIRNILGIDNDNKENGSKNNISN